MAGDGLNPKLERFCQLYIESGNATAAFKQSHPSDRSEDAHRAGAKRIMDKPAVKARIAELQAQSAEKATETVATMAAQLDEDRAFARANNSPSAAVSASVAKAKLLGLYVEKKDIQIGMRPEEAQSILAYYTEKFARGSR